MHACITVAARKRKIIKNLGIAFVLEKTSLSAVSRGYE